jgi:amidohydrolase
MDTLKEKLVALRRQIHRYPELGTREFKTAALVEKTLAAAGVSTRRIAGTGVVGIIAGRKKGVAGRVIALRADMDALPIQECTGKAYASRCAGIMHACGHDANTAMLLGAAMALAGQREFFGGKVKLVFQPNEESSGGAKSMIKAGVLKKPDIDAIVGIHVSPWLATGTLGLKRGEMMAAVDRFTIEISGDGGHGAYPHLGKDAIVIAAQVVTALQAVVARENDPVDPAVITVGTINGGERFNILCGRVTMVGTVRTLNKNVRRAIRLKMERKVHGIARAFGAVGTIVWENLGVPLINDPQMLDLCRRSGESVLGKNRVRLLEKPSMGGEDFAEYLQRVPGCFMYVGCGRGNVYPWHHEKFDIDENVLSVGANLLADIAKRYLNQ